MSSAELNAAFRRGKGSLSWCSCNYHLQEWCNKASIRAQSYKYLTGLIRMANFDCKHQSEWERSQSRTKKLLFKKKKKNGIISFPQQIKITFIANPKSPFLPVDWTTLTSGLGFRQAQIVHRTICTLLEQNREPRFFSFVLYLLVLLHQIQMWVTRWTHSYRLIKKNLTPNTYPAPLPQIGSQIKALWVETQTVT